MLFTFDIGLFASFFTKIGILALLCVTGRNRVTGVVKEVGFFDVVIVCLYQLLKVVDLVVVVVPIVE